MKQFKPRMFVVYREADIEKFKNLVEVFWADVHSSWGVDAKMSSFLSQYAKNGQVAPLLNMHQEHYEVVGNIFEQLNLSDYQNENI